MPNSTKANAKTAPAKPYIARAATKNSAACILRLLPVNRDRGPRDLRAAIGREMNQERSDLGRLHPLRAVRLGIAGAIAWSIHRARQHRICGDAPVFVLQCD